MMEKLIDKTLRDVKVELTEEFDRNFERQAFFTEKWQRRQRGGDGRAILTKSGALRKSIHSRISDGGKEIVFFTDLPYASIHNEGGVIKVTPRMKRFFWAKFIETRQSFGRRKNGSLSRDKRNAILSAEASYWKAMALKKVDSEIRIPRRQFLGYSPEVERAVREIIEENLGQYFNQEFYKHLNP